MADISSISSSSLSSFRSVFPLMMLLLLCFVSLVSTLESGPFQIPIHYSLFKQCNSSWGNDIIENKTICEVGCLLSSVSMALNYYDIKVDGGKMVNPGTLNSWLKQNEGYLKDDELVETALQKLPGVHYNGSLKYISPKAIIQNLENGIVTIAHVRNGTHFVLLTGYTTGCSPTTCHLWAVNDPGFNQTSYYTTDIVGFRIFTIEKKNY